MRLLLDTHVWLWQVIAPDRLSKAARAALDDPDTELFLSAISAWETLVLARKGRLDLGDDPVRWVRGALRRSPLRVLDLSHDVALRSEALAGYDNPDPGDRFIVATALVFELTVVTADARMQGYAAVPTRW